MDESRAHLYFREIYSEVEWKHESIRMYGKVVPQPRLIAWYGDKGLDYTYSGIRLQPTPWTPVLLEIKNKIETASGVYFNSALLNLYRDERDSVSWHSDDEPELGLSPVIGSVSLGQTRRFELKNKKDPAQRLAYDLSHGSFLLMMGESQSGWLHQVPKENYRCGPRINLTFRTIQPSHDRVVLT